MAPTAVAVEERDGPAVLSGILFSVVLGAVVVLLCPGPLEVRVEYGAGVAGSLMGLGVLRWLKPSQMPGDPRLVVAVLDWVWFALLGCLVAGASAALLEGEAPALERVVRDGWPHGAVAAVIYAGAIYRAARDPDSADDDV